MKTLSRRQLMHAPRLGVFYHPRVLVRVCRRFWLLTLALVSVLPVINGCLVVRGPAMIPVEGVIQAAESGAPLTEVTVVIRSLHSGDEFGRGEGTTDATGQFRIVVSVLAEVSAPDVYEVTVVRDGCESVFSLDADIEVEFVDLPFPQTFFFRITDPILVPPCEAEGGGAP